MYHGKSSWLWCIAGLLTVFFCAILYSGRCNMDQKKSWYHDRSPYNPYQSSGKYSSKQSSSVSEGRPERVSNINGGTGSRSNSPRSRHSNMSPRSHRVKSSYSKTRELSKRGSSSSPVDTVSHHSSSASDRMLKVDSISTDDSFPWSQHTSSSGKTYYYNCKTEKSQWEKPKEWLEREYRLGREKKKREAKEKTDHSRDNVHSNQAMSTKGSSRESSREQSSSTKRDGSTGSVERDRAAYLREESKRLLQHNQANYQSNSHVVKTTSANTSAVSTAAHRPDLLPARSDSTVSPSGSLQDVSPPVTPATMSIQNSSPRVTVSPIITTRSPVMLSHQQSPIVQNQSPVHPNAQRQLATHLCNSSTPPPPPPPIAPHTSSAHIVTGGYTSSYTGIPAQNSAQVNAINSSAKLTENQSFNGIHALSQSQLHPLQQATLLQAQFHGASNARAVAPGVLSASSPGAVQPHFQPVKQSSSTRASPVPFNVHPYPRVSSTVQLSSVATQKASLVYAPPQSANIQDFAPLFNRGLISHTTGWPSEPMEKQAQRSLDDTLSLSLANHRLKADLVPLNFHHNLTAMRMGVGAKRIEFLRQQTRKLETSDSIS